MTKICRLFVKGNFSRKFEDTRQILKEASETDFKARYFVTPGGFIVIPWKFQSFKEAVHEAKIWAEKLIRGIEINADCITIGIDSHSSKNLRKPHVELVGLKGDEWHFTGKIYPTVEQQKGLLRSDFDSHFLEVGERVMILGCHDLNIFNPRSIKTAKGWRKEVSDKFRDKAKEFSPEIVLHHPHYTDSFRIWLSAWRNLERELSSVNHYASSSVYFRSRGERSDLNKVLRATKKGDVLDTVFDFNS
jgi:hypothetical protein